MNLFGASGYGAGVHVPEHKEQTAQLPIRRLPFPPMLIVPLSQHAGEPAKANRPRRPGSRPRRAHRQSGRLHARPDARPGHRTRRAHRTCAPVARGELSPAIYIKPYASASQEVLYGARAGHRKA